MREIDKINHPHCLVKIYGLNDKWIVRLDFSKHAIEHKFDAQTIDLQTLKNKITSEWIDLHASIFNQLYDRTKEITG